MSSTETGSETPETTHNVDTSKDIASVTDAVDKVNLNENETPATGATSTDETKDDSATAASTTASSTDGINSALTADGDVDVMKISAMEQAVDITEAEIAAEEDLIQRQQNESKDSGDGAVIHAPDIRRKSLISQERKVKWARKHEKIHKYKHEHNKDPDWYKHKKHILICSWAGRPIYTRYGDDTSLAAYMGVISAIISNFQNHGDKVRSIVAGKTKFVFLLAGPVYLVSISRTSESVEQLRKQLSYVHQQIVSVLTGSIHSILEARPGYDIRNLMGGMEHLLTDLISESNK